MKKVIDLINREKIQVIGVLSGTSVDAVDVVNVEIKGSGISTQVKVINFESFPIPGDIRNFILENSDKSSAVLDNISQMNFLIGHLFADNINEFLKKYGLSPKDIDLVGSHGQTIHHVPEKKNLFGYDIRSTLQLGDPSVIANKTGIITVGDFRVADMALGGEGAPLVPYLDYVLFRSEDKNRMLVNIGGIANVTYLTKGCSLNDVIAFDTGPGNMVIDRLMKEFYDKTYDDNGRVASKGKINQMLLEELLKFDNFYNKKPPKSTGREFYGESFVEYVLSVGHGVSDPDIIRTVTDYTAYTIHYNVSEFIKNKPDEILVSGGGASNDFLMGLIEEYFLEADVKPLNEGGISTDNKEAVLFAVLANEAVHGNPANVPSVSGAEKSAVLGKICLA